MYKDIYDAARGLFGKDCLNWGCQILSEVPLSVLQIEYHWGEIVQTLDGDYWIWYSNE